MIVTESVNYILEQDQSISDYFSVMKYLICNYISGIKEIYNIK